MKQVVSLGTAWLLFALCALLQHTPVLSTSGHVRGHVGTTRGVSAHRLLRRQLDGTVEEVPFEEDETMMEGSADEMDAPNEGSADPDVSTGTTTSTSDNADSMEEPILPSGPASVISVNVTISYTLGNITMEEAVSAAEQVSVLKAGPPGRRTQELTPTEAEIDTLINNTFDFYSQVYMQAFGDALISVMPTTIVTQDVSPGSFLVNYEVLLSFSSPPTTEEVEFVTDGIDTTEYIEMYVKPSGPYFSATEVVGVSSVAADVPPTEPPTMMATPAPTGAPTQAPVAATASPTQPPETSAPTAGVPETASPTTEVPETASPTTGVPETASPTAGVPEQDATEETVAPTTGEAVATDSPTEGQPVETSAPTNGTVETTEPMTAAPTEPEVVETPAPTPPPTESEATDGTEAPTACPGRSTRVVGTVLLQLDPAQELTEPTEAQVVEIAQHILQAFGVLLREEYDNGIRGFSATIDETKSALDGNAYPLGFDATILFSPCAPPLEELNAVFADADYPTILGSFVPTGDDNVFQHLTGEATYTGEATIEF